MKEGGDDIFDGEAKSNGETTNTTSTTASNGQVDGKPKTDVDGDTQMTDGNPTPVPTATTTTATKPKESPAARLQTVQNKLNDSKSKNLLLVEKMEGLLSKLNDTSNRSRVSHYVNYSRNGLMSKRK
ncbi:unnamed protein product [Ambrosiozyma monospora]|uniref:Unnamed protein product n=1 Tax=Ambrosiozyma monospora TaxID=43982 RepID=A0A9W7DMA6_AMBMO|nr:unnamed protein product [Ambrosiozyma monospora]